ncbi:peptidase [Evansella sp. AB-P1]|uniref:peptidase n=1 Tax=Evansella sp. AB-P1 TaxID=3037653 RepID=UPI00241DDF48|nr:peptidase [Evansella sp. AB-P1]MDG5787515.1 peptidase [Evansella sp. AB-P1]
MDANKKISQWMNENRSELIELIKTLVREPSVQKNEATIQQLVEEYLLHMDYDVDKWEIGGEDLLSHDAFISPRNSFIGSPNVVGVNKGSDNGKSIVLNGHVDVVPEGDIKDWEADPFSGAYMDGKVYGRGSTDMKGGNAAMLFALKSIYSLQLPTKGDIIFHSVIDEESGGAGTLAAILRGYTADASIIPEPTNMKIFPKQQGSMWFRIYVKGKSAHGGTSYEGTNAIEKCQKVINSLKQLERIRNKRVKDPLFSSLPIPLPINIGVIEGGEWPSSVPDLVKLEGRVGVSPDETIEEVKAEVSQWLKGLAEDDDWFEKHPVQVEWFGARWFPGSIDVEHPLMKMLTNNFTNILGYEPTIAASPWGTDGGLLTTIGQTPSVVFGPGVTNMAHFSNEYVEVDKVLACSKIIACTVYEWVNEDRKK